MAGATNNTVGGTAAGARNLISGTRGEAGSYGDGVLIEGSGTSANQVEGNYIGTNAAGSGALANRGDGVFISGASNNTVGGTAAGARNLISGNGGQGVAIVGFADAPSGGAASNNQVEGNYIGTNAAGSGAVGNGHGGVLISGPTSGFNTSGATTTTRLAAPPPGRAT